MNQIGKDSKNIVKAVFTTPSIKYPNYVIIFVNDNNYLGTWNTAVDLVLMLMIKFAFVIV